MHVYPALPDAASVTGNGEVPGDGSLMVAVWPGDLASPLRSGRIPGGGDRSALVIGGTAQVRTGEPLVFCKVVVVAPAQVRRDGQVQAQGSPLDHATLGRGLSNNGTASGDSGPRTAGLPSVAVRVSKECWRP